MGELVGLVAVLGVFGIPIFALWTGHRRRMIELEIQLRMQQPAQNTGSMQSLRDDLNSLRETTLQYDVSFDTALQRLERRIEHLERQQASTRQDEPQVVELGRNSGR